MSENMPESSRSKLVDLVAQAGPAPEGVDQITHIIASTPAGELSRAARRAAPSYQQLVYDKQIGGDLIQHLRDNPEPEIALANAIMLKQQALSKTRRRLASAGVFLAFFAGGAELSNGTINELDQGLPAHYRTHTQARVEKDAAFGGIAGAGGFLLANLVGISFSGRLARKPAQKIVRRAKENSTQ